MSQNFTHNTHHFLGRMLNQKCDLAKSGDILVIYSLVDY